MANVDLNTRTYLNEEIVYPQLVGSDLILMIPGRFSGVKKTSGETVYRLADAYKDINAGYPSEDGDVFIETIEDSIAEEISPSFRFEHISEKTYNKNKSLYDTESVKKVESNSGEYARDYIVPQFERFNLGKIDIIVVPDEEIKGRVPHNMVISNAFAVTLTHIHSRCSVVEIYIPDCQDTIHVLEAFRHGRLLLKFPDGTETYKEKDAYNITTIDEEIESLKESENFKEIDEFLNILSITPLALRRSAIFAYGDHDDQEYINCLANEEAPKDGHVSGRLKEKILHENRAQYEGIRTYASSVTLLEIIEKKGLDLASRIDYQTTELFFIEMLLIRDVSTEDIMQKLYNVSELISEDLITGKKARRQLEKIHQNLSNAITFTGTTQYLWPTVQESVKLLSKDFDIDDIERRYKEAENVIEDKIDALVRKDEAETRKRTEKNDKIKNFFLFALTLCGWISAVKEGIELFQDLNPITVISISLVILAIIIYTSIIIARKVKNKKEDEKDFDD